MLSSCHDGPALRHTHTHTLASKMMIVWECAEEEEESLILSEIRLIKKEFGLIYVFLQQGFVKSSSSCPANLDPVSFLLFKESE